jgi:hypothetical protein
LDEYLDKKKAKKLVDWVKKGGQPEEFGQKEPKEASEDPYAANWAQLGPAFKVKYKGGEGYEVRFKAQGHQAAWNAASAASKALGDKLASTPIPALGLVSATPTAPAGIPVGRQVQSTPGDTVAPGIAWGVIWSKVKHLPILRSFIPNSSLLTPHSGPWGRLFSYFRRYFNFVNGWVQRIGIKNKYFAAAITIFLTLWAGSFLISHASRLLTRLAYRIAYSSQIAPQSRSAPVNVFPTFSPVPVTPTPNSTLVTPNSAGVVSSPAVPTFTPSPAARSRPSPEASAKGDGAGGTFSHLPPERSQSGGGSISVQSPKVEVASHGVTAQGVLENNGVGVGVQGKEIGPFKIPGVDVTIGANSAQTPIASTTPNPKQDQTGKIIEDTVGSAAKKLFGF